MVYIKPANSFKPPPQPETTQNGTKRDNPFASPVRVKRSRSDSSVVVVQTQLRLGDDQRVKLKLFVADGNHPALGPADALSAPGKKRNLDEVDGVTHGLNELSLQKGETFRGDHRKFRAVGTVPSKIYYEPHPDEPVRVTVFKRYVARDLPDEQSPVQQPAPKRRSSF